MRAKFFNYIPPIWVMSWVLGKVRDTVVYGMQRSVEHAARAVFHVATSPELEQSPGGLFSDQQGAFLNCGRRPDRCGRLEKLPVTWSLWGRSERTEAEAARVPKFGKKLWQVTEEILKNSTSKKKKKKQEKEKEEEED